MNRLEYNRVYLCGSMEYSVDNGQDWRINIQKELKDLDLIFLDPTQKPTAVALEDEHTKALLQELRAKGDYDTLKYMMSAIRAYDLRMVDMADFLIVHLDFNIQTTGSWEEIFLANRSKKPILLHYAQGRENIPYWLWGTLPKQTMFSTWEEVHNYIRHIAHDENIDDLNRWRFWDFSLGRQV
jgi:hypothetical protein